MSKIVRTYSTPCFRCGTYIRWSDDPDVDDQFIDVWDKLKFHLEHDRDCKLSGLLGENKPDPQWAINTKLV